MKAILVLDKMPKTCRECKITYLDTGDDAYFGANVYRCVIDNSEIYTEGRQYDCPLKPMPEKKDEHVKIDNWGLEGIINAEHRGYNRCLEDLLGDEE